MVFLFIELIISELESKIVSFISSKLVGKSVISWDKLLDLFSSYLFELDSEFISIVELNSFSFEIILESNILSELISEIDFSFIFELDSVKVSEVKSFEFKFFELNNEFDIIVLSYFFSLLAGKLSKLSEISSVSSLLVFIGDSLILSVLYFISPFSVFIACSEI